MFLNNTGKIFDEQLNIDKFCLSIIYEDQWIYCIKSTDFCVDLISKRFIATFVGNYFLPVYMGKILSAFGCFAVVPRIHRY